MKKQELMRLVAGHFRGLEMLEVEYDFLNKVEPGRYLFEWCGDITIVFDNTCPEEYEDYEEDMDIEDIKYDLGAMDEDEILECLDDERDEHLDELVELFNEYSDIDKVLDQEDIRLLIDLYGYKHLSHLDERNETPLCFAADEEE